MGGWSANLLEGCNRLVGRHHVGILVGHIEQVDSVRGKRAVVAGILRNGAAEVIGKAINNRTAYAARCRTADNDHGIAALVDQVARQRCAEEGGRMLLGKENIAFLWRDLRRELIPLRGDTEQCRDLVAKTAGIK